MTPHLSPTETRRVMADVTAPDLHGIAQDVCGQTGVGIVQLRSVIRTQPTARARQLFMWQARRQGHSLSSIGRYLNRDHTTIIHGIRRITEIMETSQ